MNARDAIIEILKQAEKPLHSKEIVKQVMNSGLWAGKSPLSRISSLLYTDKEIFKKVAPATFRLAQVDEDPDFAWTEFYEAVADKLLLFKDKREELAGKMYSIADQYKSDRNKPPYLQDESPEGVKFPMKDMCPFTAMGIFNRSKEANKRTKIAQDLADFLEIKEKAPDFFDGIPLLDSRNSWFYPYAHYRQPDDIPAHWDLLAKAIELADSENENTRNESARLAFINAYNRSIKVHNVGYMYLTRALYWIRPWYFPTLDNNSLKYIKSNLKNIDVNLEGNYCSAEEYLSISDKLKTLFQKETSPVNSFPYLSYIAYIKRDEVLNEIPNAPYGIDNIVSDGCFAKRKELEDTLTQLEEKKNLVLQGPPGTGKTWLAKRLAYALIDEEDSSKITSVQFHPNFSYEDFVEGYRPASSDDTTKSLTLNIKPGPFLKAIGEAEEYPNDKYVIIIEEINRGNPAQIFGEMLTLLENSKRKKEEAINLLYSSKPVYIPSNLYVIGTMNTADRSIAMIDYALRRRFAFRDMKPQFNEAWKSWGHGHGISETMLEQIKEKMEKLNDLISRDDSLGEQFVLGHSFVTPHEELPENKDEQEWFNQIIETEIYPLLKEYWFDNPEKAKTEKDKLLQS